LDHRSSPLSPSRGLLGRFAPPPQEKAPGRGMTPGRGPTIEGSLSLPDQHCRVVMHTRRELP
jgi:hypothetical protein